MNEWALLIFSVCVPAAVGGFLFLYLFHKKIVSNGMNPLQVLKLPLLVLTGVAIIGLFAAFFHLGSPMHAFYTILRFGQSWMSNEIVFTSLFIAMACITTGLAIVQKKVNPILLLLTGLVGLVDVYSMATIYAVTRINGWDNLNTYVVFFGSVFTLGPVLAAGVLSTTYKHESYKDIMKWAFAIVIFGMAIQIVGTALLSASMTEVELVNGVTAIEKLSQYNSVITSRWVLEVAGVAVLGFLAVATLKKINYSLVYVAIAVLFIAEAMSRYVFYTLGA